MKADDRHEPFPLSTHLPVGRPYGRIDDEGENPTSDRPFGMLLARPCAAPVRLDVTAYGYDASSQTGTVRTSNGVVPLAKHTDGQTNTVTDGGDGQNTNKDSDSDVRED